MNFYLLYVVHIMGLSHSRTTLIVRTVSFIGNIFLFFFTFFILISEGASDEIAYVMLSVLLLCVPIFNAVIIYQNQLLTRFQYMENVAFFFNIILMIIAGWAFFTRHPSPNSGIIIFVMLVFLTIILTIATLNKFRESLSLKNS